MAQNSNGQAGLEQLPYFREYLEQILKPRVGKIIDEIRSSLTEQVWAHVLDRMSREQNGNADPASIERMRAMLEQALKLRMTAHIVADFDGAGYAQAAPGASAGGAEVRDSVDVVDAGFPNNPLARAVGGIRRVSR
jgi:hypothetical protein